MWTRLSEKKPDGYVVLRMALFPKTMYVAKLENKMWYLPLVDTYISLSPSDEWMSVR